MTDDLHNPPEDGRRGGIAPIAIEDELKRSYLDYAMSVIVSRALPDARDGLKPVHRRILFSMSEQGHTPDRSYVKSARVVGDVMGKYHPHGDSAIYMTLVRLAQPFSMGLLLIDGQGNFGSVDNDPPAAMRYTECRLTKASMSVLADLDKNTVDFKPNYDGSEHEPSVLPSRIPNLLVNGAGGIAVGMATNIPPHNLGEVIDACLAYVDNSEIGLEELADIVRDKRIEGVADLRDESDRDGMRVVVEIKRDASAEVLLNQLYRFTPLQSSFAVNMLALDRGRPREMNLRDLIVAFIEFREEVVVRRTKFELSKARDRGHVLVGLAIAVANIDEVIHIIRSSKDPAEARERLTDRSWPAGDMMPLVDLIADPRTVLLDGNQIRLTEEQSRAILALTLSRLTGLGRDEIFGEAGELATAIQGYLAILASRERVMGIVRDELIEVKTAFAVPRRTEILEGGGDMDDEDLIAREDMVIAVTHSGYVKRTPLATSRTQHRGGKGRSGMSMKEEDVVTRVFSANTHTPVLFFSSGGKVYKLKVWRLPVGAPNSRGKAFVNLLPIEPGEAITSILPLPEDEASWDQYDVMFATRSGNVRRNKLSDFVQINRNGKIAMKLDEGDAIIGVAVCQADQDVLLTTSTGRCIRFSVEEVRVFASRDSTGVRGVRLAEGDSVISMAILRSVDATPAERAAYLKHATATRAAESGEAEEPTAPETEDEDVEAADQALSLERIAALGAAEEFILTVSSEGFGKRSSAYDFRRTGRGGQGLIAQDLTKRGGKLTASFPVEEGDEILLVTDQGQLIRTPVAQVRIAGRNTQGVTIFRTAADEHVVSVERLAEGSDGAVADGEIDGDGPGDDGLGAPSED